MPFPKSLNLLHLFPLKIFFHGPAKPARTTRGHSSASIRCAPNAPRHACLYPEASKYPLSGTAQQYMCVGVSEAVRDDMGSPPS